MSNDKKHRKEMADLRMENAQLKNLLVDAKELAVIATDWNINEVEIRGKWVSTHDLARKFIKASEITNKESK